MARIGLAAVALGAAVVLSGCGGSGDDSGGGGDGGDAGGGGVSAGESASDGAGTLPGSAFAEQSADDIVASAKADMGDLDAVRVSGSLSSGDQQVDVDIQAGGGNCTGTIGVGEGTAELLGADGDVWMRPDKTFWRTAVGEQAAPQIINAVGDKWVVIPSQEESLSQFCDVDTLLDQLLDAEDGTTYSKAGTDELDGEDVVKIDNEDDKGDTSTGYVLVEEPHYLVKIEKTEGEDTGSVTFSDFDEAFEVEAPAEDEIIDLTSISG